jgi:ribosomal protein L37AE/L43A
VDDSGKRASASARLWLFRCPRCEEAPSRQLSLGIWRRKCPSCGLSLKEPAA